MIQQVFRPASLREAANFHETQGALYLSGGTYVNWAASGVNPERVILLEGLLDDAVARREEGIEIGAGITLQALKDAPAVPASLRRAAGFIPSRCVRNMATLGGNIAANRSDSYLVPTLIALSARVETVEQGSLTVEDYITRGEDALITRVVLPAVAGTSVLDRVVLSSAAYPTLTLAVRVAGGEAVIAVGCLADHVIRLREVEERIAAGELETETEVFDAVYAAVDPPAGLKESAAYRRYIAAVTVARAVMESRKERG